MDPIAQLSAEVIEHFELLSNPESTTDTVSMVTEWLQEFYASPESLDTLIFIIQNSDVNILRQHAAIAIKESILFNWDEIETDHQQSLFTILTSAVLSESVPEVRSSIIVALENVMSQKYTDFILDLVQEQLNDTNATAVLNLMELICKDQEATNSEMVQEFVLDLLKRCFETDDIALNLAAVGLLAIASKTEIIPSLEFCWDHLLALFDDCSGEDMQTLVLHFNNLLDQSDCYIDYPSVLEKTLGMLSVEQTDIETQLVVFSVVDAVIMNGHFTRTLSSDDFMMIVNTAFRLILEVFDPIDASRNEFFESVIKDLVLRERADMDLPLLWDVCTGVDTDIDAGRFAVLSALKATVEQSGNFYDSKIEDIIQLFLISMQSDLEIVIETVVSVVADFKPVLERVNVPMMNELAQHMLVLVEHCPTRLYIGSLASLLEAMDDTQELFDDVIQEILEIISSEAVPVEPEMLDCISGLMVGGEERVTDYIEQIVDVIQNTLTSDEEYDFLKIPAMNMLRILLQIHYDDLVGDGVQLYSFLQAHISSNNTEMVVAALSILETIFETYPTTETVIWTMIDFDLLIEIGTQDISASFTSEMKEQSLSQPDGGVPYKIRFMCAEKAVKIMSLAIRMNDSIFQQFAESVLQMCYVQISSFSNECITAGYQSLEYIVSTLLITGEMTPSLFSDIVKFVIRAAVQHPEPEALRVLRSILFESEFKEIDLIDLLMYFTEFEESKGEMSFDDSIIMIHQSIIVAAAESDPADLLEFATYCHSQVQGDSRVFMIYTVAQIALCLPADIDNHVKQNVFSVIMQKAATDPDAHHAVYLLGELTCQDKDFITPFWKQVLNVLTTGTNSSNTMTAAMGIIGLMKATMSFMSEENQSDFEDVIATVIPALPVTGDGGSAMIAFLEWITEKSDDMHREVVRICVQWFVSGIAEEHTERVKAILQALIESHEDVVRDPEVLNNDEIWIEKLTEFLADDEEDDE